MQRSAADSQQNRRLRDISIGARKNTTQRRALGIEQRGLHSFRHTTTSILIEAGVPLPQVREIVGHASVSTTLGIYGHVLTPAHREAMSKVGQILLPDVTEFGGNSLVQ